MSKTVYAKENLGFRNQAKVWYRRSMQELNIDIDCTGSKIIGKAQFFFDNSDEKRVTFKIPPPKDLIERMLMCDAEIGVHVYFGPARNASRWTKFHKTRVTTNAYLQLDGLFTSCTIKSQHFTLPTQKWTPSIKITTKKKLYSSHIYGKIDKDEDYFQRAAVSCYVIFSIPEGMGTCLLLSYVAKEDLFFFAAKKTMESALENYKGLCTTSLDSKDQTLKALSKSYVSRSFLKSDLHLFEDMADEIFQV